MLGFGIDIGGTGIKGAQVDLEGGDLASERIRIPTPAPATVDSVLDVVAEVVSTSDWDGPVGCTFPGVVRHGVVSTAANVDDSWLGVDLDSLLTERLSHPVHVVNDADAAGIAEMRYGAGRGQQGVVMVLTLGTGIGSATFVDGVLFPNTELGHLELDGALAESRAANSSRKAEELSFPEWTERLQRYFSHLERLFSPDLFIVGGGVSKKADKFLPHLELKAPIVPAALRNASGIVGAAAMVGAPLSAH